MAAIYLQKPDELHIYHNRVPKADGREPRLIGAHILTALFLLRAGLTGAALLPVLFSDMYRAMLWQLISEAPGLYLSDILFLVLIGLYPFTQYQKLVFSAKTREVYSSFLFFRRRVAKFSELGDIKVSDQEMLGITSHMYVITWRSDKLRKPLRISPKVKKFERLARYYHTVAPLLAEMLHTAALPDATPAAATKAPRADAPDAVVVEEIEVPVTEAANLLAGPAASAPAVRRSADDAGGDGKTFRWFTLKNGLYRNRMTFFQMCAVLLAFAPMVFALFFALNVDFPPPLRVGGGVGLLIFAFLFSRESLWIALDPDGRAVVVGDRFGFRKTRHPLSDMKKVTLKHIGPCKALCIVLKGRKVDPTIMETMSMAKVGEAMDEFADIMGLDADTILRV